MSRRASVLTYLALAGSLAAVIAWQSTHVLGITDQAEPKSRQTRAEARKAREKIVTPGPGPHLAFDVRPRDHRQATRYVLEITHPSGQVTTHDVNMPKLQGRTLVVPLPKLDPGSYQFTVIAENPHGKTRSKPLTVEMPPK